MAKPVATSTRTATRTVETTGRTTLAGAGWTLHRGLMVTGFALSIVSPAVFGMEGYSFLGPMLVPVVIALIFVAVTARPWGYLTAAILGGLFPLFVTLVFGLMEGWLTGGVGPNFVAAGLNVGALLLVVPTGISGFVAARRGNTIPLSRSGWDTSTGRYAVGVLALLLGAVLASAAATTTVRTTTETPAFDFAPDATLTVTAVDFEFAQTAINLAQDQVTEIVLVNEDPAEHTFTYVQGDTEYNHLVLGDATVRFLVRFDDAGVFQFRCLPHSENYDDGMVGTITVA